MSQSEEYKFYVLNPQGSCMSRVIFSGPYTLIENAELSAQEATIRTGIKHEVHALNCVKVERALQVEEDLQIKLGRYGGSYLAERKW